MLKICVAGPCQSGSTRLFNLIRLLYLNSNKRVKTSWEYNSNEDSENIGKYDIILSKIHKADENYLKNFDICIMPYRDFRDASISNAKRWSYRYHCVDDYIRQMLNNTFLFNSLFNHVHYLFKYEDYSLEYIKKLCVFLNIHKEDSEIESIMNELHELHISKTIVKTDDLTDEFYRTTLISQIHNTSNGQSKKYITHFSAEDNKKILENQEIYEFLSKNNYLD
jgi:hypothetical protein